MSSIMEFISHHSNLLLKEFLRLYRNYEWTLSFSDKRVADWPLMKSPIPTVALIIFYLNTVYFGPIIMKNRKPLQMRWVLLFYNLFMMLLNLYIGVELLVCALRRSYNWSCQLVDFSENPHEVRIAKALWWYYFSKFLEFFDTWFFILRKKNNQLSFLHIYHHSTMFGLWWIGVKWVPGGSSLPGAMANSFVHVLMYSYYALSAIGPALQPYLWWKKYLTIVQLIQFVSAMVMGIKAIIYNCQFTRWMQYALVAYSFSFIVLFGNFYRNSYSKKNIQKKLN
ncbi:elongation of very long chain fatty acids protein 4-like [Uloborus diversus]|uniref:elongation of very long chain fatty acids protein 4-like n=1 Tax=Uloborus diversus TaxID=327109 RepID=UPI0024098B09|nr:elongation of very long chain fatty acids protein 4-like [Uloborus diversus]